jgi:ABC-type lipopolysaccharide export system ATPase subunit
MKQPLIRTIYLYLFTLIGLILITIGSVNLINLGLKRFIFTKADQELNYNLKPSFPMTIDGRAATEEDFISAVEKCQEKCDLTSEQKQQIASWLKDYKIWQEQEKQFDYLAQQRQREFSLALAFIIVGLPLYLYHWSTIKRETKDEV